MASRTAARWSSGSSGRARWCCSSAIARCSARSCPYLAERLEKLLGKLPLPDGKAPPRAGRGLHPAPSGGPDAARRGRRGGVRGRSRRPQLRRDRGLLSGAPRDRDLPHRARALPARRPDPAAHDDRARARPDRHRHPPGREDRAAFLHRPRHRRGDRRDHADRRQRADLPGRDARRAQPAPRRDRCAA